jgi:hypothetical protein
VTENNLRSILRDADLLDDDEVEAEHMLLRAWADIIDNSAAALCIDSVCSCAVDAVEWAVDYAASELGTFIELVDTAFDDHGWIRDDSHTVRELPGMNDLLREIHNGRGFRRFSIRWDGTTITVSTDRGPDQSWRLMPGPVADIVDDIHATYRSSVSIGDIDDLIAVTSNPATAPIFAQLLDEGDWETDWRDFVRTALVLADDL